jgi:hypothetical protein
MSGDNFIIEMSRTKRAFFRKEYSVTGMWAK